MEATRRAHFKATNRGIEVLASNPVRIDNNYLSRFPEFIDFRSRSSQGKERNKTQSAALPHALPEAVMAEELTPDEIMRSAHKDIERALRQEILERVCAAPPEFFEQLVVNLLLQMGFGGSVEEAGRAIVTGGTGDGGVDGVIDQDALGLDRVYIQAKRYTPAQLVGASAIRDFSGSLDMRRATKGLFVTTSDFTQEALKTARQLSRHVVLINGDRLATLMIRYNVGVRVEETLYLKKIDEDFFLE